MKQVLVILGFIVFLAAFSYGCWRFERWVNYKFGYRADVQEEVQPLAERVTALEKRVAELEKKSK